MLDSLEQKKGALWKCLDSFLLERLSKAREARHSKRNGRSIEKIISLLGVYP